MLSRFIAWGKRKSLVPTLVFVAIVGLAWAMSKPAALVAASDPVIVAAGDIACDPASSQFNGGNGANTVCHEKATASLIGGINPTAVLPLGDTQYSDGAFAKYSQSYGPTWGQYLAITDAVPGNHEYLTSGASGYFTYFGTHAGSSGKGYYSFNIGTWHLIAMNAECVNVGGCKAGSPQELWLKADLAANTQACILAFWHQPRFSSGANGNWTQYAPFWQDLYAAHADVVLNGHDHDYERFDLQNPSQAADLQGIREFVVGTGGADHSGGQWGTVQPNSQVRNINTFGVLQLTLHATSYAWKFVPESGKTFTDSGTTNCH
jgi:acid phosphatase type 7